jgi:hypothetical protein
MTGILYHFDTAALTACNTGLLPPWPVTHGIEAPFPNGFLSFFPKKATWATVQPQKKRGEYENPLSKMQNLPGRDPGRDTEKGHRVSVPEVREAADRDCAEWKTCF